MDGIPGSRRTDANQPARNPYGPTLNTPFRVIPIWFPIFPVNIEFTKDRSVALSSIVDVATQAVS